jgi:hypothetical protein
MVTQISIPAIDLRVEFQYVERTIALPAVLEEHVQGATAFFAMIFEQSSARSVTQYPQAVMEIMSRFLLLIAHEFNEDARNAYGYTDADPNSFVEPTCNLVEFDESEFAKNRVFLQKSLDQFAISDAQANNLKVSAAVIAMGSLRILGRLPL